MISGPKREDRRHRPNDEGADEPPGLIDKEVTDIETENPIDDTEPVAQVDQEEDIVLPMFEERHEPIARWMHSQDNHGQFEISCSSIYSALTLSSLKSILSNRHSSRCPAV